MPSHSSVSKLAAGTASLAGAPPAQLDRDSELSPERRRTTSGTRFEPGENAAAARSPGAPGQRQRFSRPDTGSRPGRRYCLITPARDEQEFAQITLQSVAEQTEPPSLWIIVDDGSTDQTPDILRQWQQKLPCLRVVTRPDRGERRLGSGVIDAFYDGYDSIDPAEFDYVCKFDLDLRLPPTYFADVMNVMEADPRLAVFSGKPYFERGGKMTSEMCGDENAVGMVKFYRVGALQQIGGFVRELMWDGIDGHRCRMLGWRARSSNDPKLRFIHLRPMGTSHKSWWTGRVRHGRGQHFMGTSPVYMLASVVYRMSRPPRVVGGLAMMWGYLSSALSGRRRYDDPKFRRFLRRYQWSCLLRGKKRATQRLEARMEAGFRQPTLPKH